MACWTSWAPARPETGAGHHGVAHHAAPVPLLRGGGRKRLGGRGLAHAQYRAERGHQEHAGAGGRTRPAAVRAQFTRHADDAVGETNWNAVWESNFQPVLVDDFVAVRADFHESIAGVKHEVIITPKMSFGTGHHATTHMMIQQMQAIDFTSKAVFDFGTGTGILAILAEKLGAAAIMAVDNDDWSITNTAENLERNSCRKVELKKVDTAEGEGRYDVILANINKNVILDNLSSLIKQLASGGNLLLSGLLEADETDILTATGKFPLRYNGKITMAGWICLRFCR